MTKNVQPIWSICDGQLVFVVQLARRLESLGAKREDVWSVLHAVIKPPSQPTRFLIKHGHH